MRLIRSGPCPPSLNLALDEALLRSGEETLRLYAWDPPAVSIGYFQSIREVSCPVGFALVRRPTGGGAIAHTGELTISWIGRRRRVDAAYDAINRLVAAALARLGIEVGPGTGEPKAAPAGLCFDAHTRYDLLAEGRKVFGSAQRRGGGRFLLHGTLVLTPNPVATGAVSLAELAGAPVPREVVEQQVVRAAREVWGVELTASAPTPREWEHARRLVMERYGNMAWSEKR